MAGCRPVRARRATLRVAAASPARDFNASFHAELLRAAAPRSGMKTDGWPAAKPRNRMAVWVFSRMTTQGSLVRAGRAASQLWAGAAKVFNPNGVAPRFHHRAATPLGLWAINPVSQGSSCLATLGFEPESLWDSTDRKSVV